MTFLRAFLLWASCLHCCRAFSLPLGIGNRGMVMLRLPGGLDRGLRGSRMCQQEDGGGLDDLERAKAGLLQEKMSLLKDYGVALTVSREQLKRDIEDLEMQMQRLEMEAKEAEEALVLQRKKIVLYEVEDELDDDNADLPTGWDSLPWSDGYKKAVKKAERREIRQAAAKNDDQEGTTRRVVVGEIYAAVTGLVLASAVVVGLTAPDNGREQLDYITLIADLEKGTQLFAKMGDDLFQGNFDAVVKVSAPGGDIEEFLTFCMVRWSIRAQRTGTPPTEVSVRAFRGSIGNLGEAAKRGDAFTAKRTYSTARAALNSFIRSVNLSIPPGTAPPMPEVPERRMRQDDELCKQDSPC